MICNMIHNSDTSQSGGLTLPDEEEVSTWRQLDFGVTQDLNFEGLGSSFVEGISHNGETIGAFMTATNTAYDGAAQAGRCVFTRIKVLQDDTDNPDRLILPFLVKGTVYLTEVYTFASGGSMHVEGVVVAEVETLADSVQSENNIVYEPILYAK